MTGHPTVVIAGDRADRHLEAHFLEVSGIQCDGLAECAQHSRRLSQLSLRRFAVDLHDFLARHCASVDHARAEVDRVVADALHSLSADLKGRIREAVSEGIQDLFLCKGFKIPIADIDILRVIVPVRIREVSVRGVIGDIPCDGIGQLSGRGNLSRQKVQDPVSAFLSALPYIEHCSRRKALHPVHIHDIAHIQDHDSPLESRADSLQHRLLLPGQIPASRRRAVVLVLAGGPSYDHDRGVRFPRGFPDQLLFRYHLLLEPGLCRPAAPGIKGVRRQPIFIGFFHGRRQHIGVPLQDGFPHAGHIIGIDHASRAGPALVIVELAAPEQGDPASRRQRQRTVSVFQKNGAFRLCFAGISGIDFPVKNHIFHRLPLSRVFIPRSLTARSSSCPRPRRAPLHPPRLPRGPLQAGV